MAEIGPLPPAGAPQEPYDPKRAFAHDLKVHVDRLIVDLEDLNADKALDPSFLKEFGNNIKELHTLAEQAAEGRY